MRRPSRTDILRPRMPPILLPAGLAPRYIAEFEHLPVAFVHVPKNGGTSVLAAMGVRARPRIHATAWEVQTLCADQLGDRRLFAVHRDPVQRLVSAYRYVQTGGNGSPGDAAIAAKAASYRSLDHLVVEGGITELARLSRLFWPQSAFVRDPFGALVVDLLPLDGLAELLPRYLGRFGATCDPLPTLNRTASSAPPLSAEAVAAIRELCRDDIALASEVVS